MNPIDPQIEAGWKEHLWEDFQAPYYEALMNFVVGEIKSHGQRIYPPADQVFAAFNHTPFDQVKVVILGQDPYHGPQQANGLCFSVSKQVAIPPSLKNIHKELHTDLGLPIPPHGDLTPWADQGVLLLNAVLTVRHKTPTSHAGKGWEQFTDSVIRQLAEQREHLVFILWGKYAQQKGETIDRNKHLVIESSHPSPYSANVSFLGSRPFSRANDYLRRHGIEPIDWDLS